MQPQMFDPMMMMMMMMQGGAPMMPMGAPGGPMGPGMPGKNQPFRGHYRRAYQQNKGPAGQNRGVQPQVPQ